jgi:hypothetical protein
VWSRLGADVTVVEFLLAIGAGMDTEMAIPENAHETGFQIQTNHLLLLLLLQSIYTRIGCTHMASVYEMLQSDSVGYLEQFSLKHCDPQKKIIIYICASEHSNSILNQTSYSIKFHTQSTSTLNQTPHSIKLHTQSNSILDHQTQPLIEPSSTSHKVHSMVYQLLVTQ